MATATATATATARLLIVDDNETILAILNDFLGCAYRVDTATTTAQALKAVSAHQPDAILLDVNMPGGDGLTMLGTMRKVGITIPVFVITGYDSPGLAEKAKQLGATEYLVKPVDLRQLDQLVAEALGVTPILG